VFYLPINDHFPINPLFHTFGTVKDVAVGIITSGTKVLACQRKRSAGYALKWEFPGGKLEPGETAQHALIRELKEELNIDAEIGPEFHRQEWVYDEGKSNSPDGQAFRVFYLLVPSFTGTLINRSFEDIQWVTPAQLMQMDILDGNREAVELLAKNAARLETAKTP
jgi:8-oxo-dGTP diphosphatase